MLRAGRAVLAARDGRPRLGDVAFIVYSAVLVAGVVGAPLIRFAVLGLIEPYAAGVVASASAGLAALFGALLVVVVTLGGGVRGPVVLRPAAVTFLAGSPLPRRWTLRRAFSSSAIVLGGLGVLVGGVLALSRVLLPGDRAVVSAGSAPGSGLLLAASGPASPHAAVLFLVGVVGFSLLLAVLWLHGQRGSRTAVVAAVVAAVTGVAGVFFPVVLMATPWGWSGLLWSLMVGGPEGILLANALSGVGTLPWSSGVSGSFAFVAGAAGAVWWPAAGSLAVGALSLLSVPRSLDAVHQGPLLEQSLRWQRFGFMVQSGDAAGAFGGLRTAPRRGRGHSLLMTGPFWLVVLRRTVLGARRTPARAIVGSSVLLACGAAVGVTASLPDGVRWMLAVPAAFLAYLAVGVWCDAVRHGVDSAGTPSLYGRGPLILVLTGAIAPLIAAFTFGAVGIAIGVLAGQVDASGVLGVWAWWALLAVWLVVLRVFDAAKGPLPIQLLMPVPTPVGDVSSGNVLLWQSDAVLLALLIGGVSTTLLPTAPLGAVALLSIALVVVACAAVFRVRKLSRPL